MHFQIKYQIMDDAITEYNTTDELFIAVHFIDDMKKRWPKMVYQIAVISPFVDLIIASNTHKKM